MPNGYLPFVVLPDLLVRLGHNQMAYDFIIWNLYYDAEKRMRKNLDPDKSELKDWISSLLYC